MDWWTMAGAAVGFLIAQELFLQDASRGQRFVLALVVGFTTGVLVSLVRRRLR